MEITNSEDENPLNWLLLPINDKVIPGEGHFLVSAKKVSAEGVSRCWMDISTPEMIADHVFTTDEETNTIAVNEYHTLAQEVVPNKVSDTFTNYDIYYTRANPKVGIEILKRELENISNKGFICEYLGYIYRDEKQIEHALEWFLKALEHGEPSSEHIYLEIAGLYDEIGATESAEKYRRRFK
jgi:tetratricopeptide (TPR) repeat protein